MERQLKEFQSLLQQKDEQAAQLMEEGALFHKKLYIDICECVAYRECFVWLYSYNTRLYFQL